MHPKDFLATIYLGDRGCKSILIDSWNERVVIQATTISRVRDPGGVWNFYSDEDITDGLIVFTEVEAIAFEPPGLIPNDFFENFSVEEYSGTTANVNNLFLFTLSISSLDKQMNYHEVAIKILAKGIYLEDPKNPDVRIID